MFRWNCLSLNLCLTSCHWALQTVPVWLPLLHSLPSDICLYILKISLPHTQLHLVWKQFSPLIILISPSQDSVLPHSSLPSASSCWPCSLSLLFLPRVQGTFPAGWGTDSRMLTARLCSQPQRGQLSCLSSDHGMAVRSSVFMPFSAADGPLPSAAGTVTSAA